MEVSKTPWKKEDTTIDMWTQGLILVILTIGFIWWILLI